MNVALRVLLIGAGALVAASATAQAQSMDMQKVLVPQDIKWAPGPGSLPPGAQAATIYGDAAKADLFAMRLKLPQGYAIAPHSHPKPEVVTVISGTLRLGMGETADRAKAQGLPAGSFFAMAPGMPHYVFIDEESVVQLNSIGPWNLAYVNPKDDPRQKTQ